MDEALARTRALAAALAPFANTPIPKAAKPHWPINYMPVCATYADVWRARELLAEIVVEPD